ncbi:MAG: hypothetical protein V3T77_01445 [Planctomycetota bacterium]
METVPFASFGKLDLRIAKILAVELHPKADRLYILTINGGEERCLVAGLRPYYTPDELLGKSIVVVWNLEPATIRGVESQGMLLAVKDGDTVSLVTPEHSVLPGSKVS